MSVTVALATVRSKDNDRGALLQPVAASHRYHGAMQLVMRFAWPVAWNACNEDDGTSDGDLRT